MIRTGYILMKLKDGIETRLPTHLDVLDGAARAAGSVDGRGPVDRAILAHTSGLRCKRCFHASQSLGRIGARHVHYNAVEQSLGLPQVVTLRVAEPDATAAIVATLRDLDQVAWVMAEPLATVPFRRPGERARTQTVTAAADLVGAGEARGMEPGSRAVAVAVIDTGVTLEHVEFAHRLRAGYDTVDLGMGAVADDVALVGDSLGRDFCARDETGHGSHVAGIIGARGLSMQPGIAGRSPIIPIRALAAAQAGGGPVFGVGALSDIDAAIKVAVDMGAKVLNMSFGTARAETDPFAPPPHAAAIAYAAAEGCIPVAAMGNSGIEEEYFPAALPECIAVGAMTLSGERADFSTIGRHIALCAPGEDIWSASLGGYADSSGTSHAAPFVAGAAALLAARAARRGHDLTEREAREALCLSARGATPNPETGWGMLDIPAALRHLDGMDLSTTETAR
jgi:subtilisin family serine protease